ncbi:MAG: tyrosine-type recombinase/integrase [Gammaproteobacteria bacterium]|nr:tyrosine-type recombinase/integrase [Gammaproteobacteria bacterium]
MYYDIKFTAKAFNSAQRLNNEDTEYRVIGKEHLRLCVNKRSKSLRVRTSIKGKRINKKIGNYPQLRLKEFEQHANSLIRQYSLGGNFALGGTVTFHDFFIEIYLPYAKKNKKSWKNDVSRYKLYLQQSLGPLTLSSIRVIHVQMLLNNLPEHLSDRSHDLVRALTSSIFSLAIKAEILERNPCKGIPAKNNCRVIKRYLTNQELPFFVRSCLYECNPTSSAFSYQALCLLLSLLTGMRIGNCRTLTKDMLSNDRTTIYLESTKSGKPQLIYLSTAAQWVIEQALSQNHQKYLFPSAFRNNESIAHPRGAFKRICIRAGIACSGSNHVVNPEFPSEELTIHCLRKTFATLALNSSAPETQQGTKPSMDTVRQLLGHSNQQITRTHYAFASDEVLIQAVESVGKAINDSIRNLPTIESSNARGCFNDLSINATERN